MELGGAKDVLNSSLEEKLISYESGLLESHMETWWGWARREDGYLVGTLIRSQGSGSELKFTIFVYSNTTDHMQKGGCIVPLSKFITNLDPAEIEEIVKIELTKVIGSLMIFLEEKEKDDRN
jgi:hypothetical protein